MALDSSSLDGELGAGSGWGSTPQEKVPLGRQLAFGLGHVLNDVCASMWFTYLLVYFHLVLGFGAAQAGLVLLVGQLADAAATPFVGYHSDTSPPSLLGGYGRRKTWHLFGTVCVAGAFPFIFSPCVTCEQAHHWAQLIYFCSFVVIFQIGWAAVQVSHLALITELSGDEHERTHLTAVRYSFTVFSNVAVYIVTWLVLHLTSGEEQQIGPADAHKFQWVVGVGLGGGLLASALFHLCLREPTPAPAPARSSTAKPLDSHGSMLRRPKFYNVGIVYTATRLFVNLSQVLTPLYLHRTLHLPGAALASVPLAMFLASFAASLVVHPINRIIGRKGAYALGACLGGAGCVWMYAGFISSPVPYEIYLIAVLFGLGGAVMLVTSLGLTADLIGPATDTAAFVYGVMSFSDKLTNGIAVVIIQHLSEGGGEEFYRWAVSLSCGGAALLGLLGTLLTRHSLHHDVSGEPDQEPIITDQ